MVQTNVTFRAAMWQVTKQAGLPISGGVALLWNWNDLLAFGFGIVALLVTAVFCYVGHNFPRGDAAHEHRGY